MADKNRLFWGVVVVVVALIMGAIIFGLVQERTSTIIGKNIEHHWNSDTYLFAMENGDTVGVSFAVYSAHEEGDRYTYHASQVQSSILPLTVN